MMRPWFYLVSVLPLLLTCQLSCATSPLRSDPSKRKFLIVNRSDSGAKILWLPPPAYRNVGTSVEMGTIPAGEAVPFDSFVGHNFELFELPHPGRRSCRGGDETCAVGRFTVKNFDEQVVFIERGFRVAHDVSMNYERQPSQPSKPLTHPSSPKQKIEQNHPQPVPLTSCQKRAAKSLLSNRHNTLDSDSTSRVLSDLLACIESNITKELEEVSRELQFQSQSRLAIGDVYENYTCSDQSFPTSEPISNTTWQHEDVTRKVGILLDRDASKIHMIEQFISDDECEAMENAARPILHRAAVANGKGGSELTSSRKAMQAGVEVPWHKEAHGNPIARLSRRVYDYTNHILGMDIKEHGQEDLMSIQYFGRGESDPDPDHYVPHCDGECSGMKHKPGTRMATMVMYCTVPKRGGATNFKNAALHVKPKKGNAVFFSYIGSDMIMDNGFTEHSGCPVIEGNKKIVVQWVRYGVDEENPWDSFNTLGVKITDES